jgi:hypothetical protein
MPKFYVTYGNNSNLAGCYSEVDAFDYADARERIMRVTQGQFAFMYTEVEYDKAIGAWGLTKIDLRQQRTPCEED